MAQFDLQLPKFNEGDLDDAKQRRRIMSYLYKLDEQLRFVLNNLDAENFTEEFQQTVGSGGGGMTSYAELENELGRLSTQIRQTAAQIELKADAEELNELGDAVSQVETDLKVIAGKIESTVTRTEFDELGNQVAANRSAITQTAEEIRSEVADEVAGLNSTISQTAGAIRAEVSNTAAGLQSQINQTPEKIELAVENVQVGGRNMLRNTGDLKISNYGFDSSGASATGTYAEEDDGFRIICNNANVRWWPGVQPVTPGQSYAMSIQYKMNSGSAPIQFQYVFKNASGGDVAYWDSVNHSVSRTRVEAGWTVLTSVFAVPSDASITNVNLAVRTGTDFALYTCDYNVRRPQFEIGNKATDWTLHPEEFKAGTNVLITKDQFKVKTPEFSVDIPTEDGTETMLRIDKEGVYTPHLESPNVAQRYDGPGTLYVNPNATGAQIAAGNYFRSLADAVAKVNNRYIDYDVSIHIASSISLYEHVTVQGVHGGGSLLIYGTSDSVLNGTISFFRCQTKISISKLNVAIPSGIDGAAYYIGTSSFVEVYDSKLSGAGRGFTVEQGSYLSARNITFLIDGTLAAYIIWATSSFENCIGNGQLLCHRAYMTAYGKVPKDGVQYWESCVPNNLDSLTPTAADGSAVQPPVTTKTVSYKANNSDVYAGDGWNNYSAEDIYQGYTTALGEHRGCFWFDNATIRSALNGKTIKQATLTLYQMSGVGRNQPVQVNLEGITATSGTGSSPVGKPEYGVIGTTLGVNQATTFTLPTAVITDLVKGTINGLMLRTGETSVMKNDDNSYHYARFAGKATAANAPVLTVVYV